MTDDRDFVTDPDIQIWIERRAIIENCVTLVCTVALILGLYAMGAGGWSAVSILLLTNMTRVKYRRIGGS